MRWTSRSPGTPGWWWFKRFKRFTPGTVNQEFYDPVILRVEDHGGKKRKALRVNFLSLSRFPGWWSDAPLPNTSVPE
jgi:hypothetical protein